MAGGDGVDCRVTDNEVHAAKVRKTKEQSIVISEFKTDMPPILVGLVVGKESTTPLTDIGTPEL